MKPLTVLGGLTISIIFGGLTEMIIETLIEEHRHPIMSVGYSLVCVGFAIVSTVVAVLGLWLALAVAFERNTGAETPGTGKEQG